MSGEDITRVIAYSKRRRDIAHDNVMHLEEVIADLEAKPALTDDDCILLNHIAGKLHVQMYNGEFHKHHYWLIDNSDGEVHSSKRLSLQLVNSFVNVC